MKLVRSLVWTVLSYGAESWTLKKADEKRIESAEMWIYRRLLWVSWTEHRTDESILLHQTASSVWDGGCELVKCVIQGKVNGKRRRGRQKTSYSSNITKWMKRITRDTCDRDEWRRLIRCAGRPVTGGWSSLLMGSWKRRGGCPVRVSIEAFVTQSYQRTPTMRRRALCWRRRCVFSGIW